MALEFVALDVETANAFHGSVCQVGLASVTDGRVEATWQSLTRPPEGWETFAADHVEVHGITAEDVHDAPRFIDVWPQIDVRVRGRPVVAHNANFDIRALQEALGASGSSWPDLDVACSLVLSRKRYDLPVHSLDACCAAAGVVLHRHHDALADAIACAELTVDMATAVGAQSLAELLDASGVAWGRLTANGYTSCVSVGKDKGQAEATLF